MCVEELGADGVGGGEVDDGVPEALEGEDGGRDEVERIVWGSGVGERVYTVYGGGELKGIGVNGVGG